MALRRAIGALVCLTLAGGILSALSGYARAETYLSARVGQTRFAIDLPDRLVPPKALQNVVTLSSGSPVKPILVPVTIPERWRFSLTVTGMLGYGPFHAGYRPVSVGSGDGMTALRQDGSAFLMSYQTPSGSFGAAIRVGSTGAIRLVVDHVAQSRWGAGAGVRTVKGIEPIAQPAPVPLPAPGLAFLAALAPLGFLAHRRRR